MVESHWINDGTMEVLFESDMGNVAGDFNLVATRPSFGADAVLENAFQVTSPCGTWSGLGVGIEAPGTFRSGLVGRLTVRYTNLGDRMLQPRILRIRVAPMASDPTAPEPLVQFRLDDRERTEPLSALELGDPSTDYRSGPIYVLTAGRDGRMELAPKESAAVSLEFLTDLPGLTPPPGGDSLTFYVDEFNPTQTDYEGLACVTALPAPPGMGSEDWQTTQAFLREKLGCSWIGYAPYLATIGSCRRRIGEPSFSVKKLFQSAVRDALGLDQSTIIGRARDAAGAPLRHVLVVAEGPVTRTTRTDISGIFSFSCLRPGNYCVRLANSAGPGEDVEITEGCGVSGIELVISGPVPEPTSDLGNSCSAFRIPDSHPALPESLFTPREQVSTWIVQAADPNEKIGPGGAPGSIVYTGAVLPYSIHFENTSAAAEVGKVEVKDLIENFAPPGATQPFFYAGNVVFTYVNVGNFTFPFGSYFTGNCPAPSYRCFHWELGPPWSQSKTARIYQIPKNGTDMSELYYLDVRAWIDWATYDAKWSFTTMKCASPLQYCSPTSPGSQGFQGFLAKAGTAGNTNRAHVAYSVILNTDSNFTGMTLPNDALVYFDCGTPFSCSPGSCCLQTNTWWNCINVGGCTPPGDGGGGGQGGFALSALQLEFPRPADGASVDPGSTYLAWEDFPGRVGDFRFKLWRSTEPEPAGFRTSAVAAAPAPDLAAATNYLWRVEAERILDAATTELISGGPWTIEVLGSPTLPFVRGNANGVQDVDMSDAVFILNHLFGGGPAPICLRSADVNGDGAVDVPDAIALLRFLFLGDCAPASPFPCCATDRNEGLECESAPPCSGD
jgi:hypothetical protein